eukprot:scaffold1117_cov379-Prasinococcus_capsulatus_cf.AAC.2
MGGRGPVVLEERREAGNMALARKPHAPVLAQHRAPLRSTPLAVQGRGREDLATTSHGHAYCRQLRTAPTSGHVVSRDVRTV